MGVLVLARDVTGSRAVEDALHRSQAQLAEAQQVAHIGSWDWDMVADTIRWSEEMYRLSTRRPGRRGARFRRLHGDHPPRRPGRDRRDRPGGDRNRWGLQDALPARGGRGQRTGDRRHGDRHARHRWEGRVDGGHRARRHRRASKPRGTTAPRGGVPAGAEAGGPRAALRRDRARLQQRVDGDPRLCGAGTRPARPGQPCRTRRGGAVPHRGARDGAAAAAARLRTAADGHGRGSST